MCLCTYANTYFNPPQNLLRSAPKELQPPVIALRPSVTIRCVNSISPFPNTLPQPHRSQSESATKLYFLPHPPSLLFFFYCIFCLLLFTSCILFSMFGNRCRDLFYSRPARVVPRLCYPNAAGSMQRPTAY